MAKKQLIEIFGWYGTAAIVGSYALVSWSLLNSNTILYQLLNLTGAIGIIAISFYKRNYQPAVLNIIWVAIAFFALVRIFTNL